MNNMVLVNRKLIVTNKSKYPTDEIIKLLKFARQLLPVNPLVHIGTTYRGWKGWAKKHEIALYLGKANKFPTQLTPKYCFKGSWIPDHKMTWDSALLMVAAHEFYHVYQMVKGVPCSEKDAEAYCISRLMAYLSTKGINPPIIKAQRWEYQTIHGVTKVKYHFTYCT